MLITKASGEQVLYESQKLIDSLTKTGAADSLVKKIVQEVEAELYPGISSKKIYQKAFSLLRKASRPSAAKYKLKRALLELGPSGYPFEKYMGALLTHRGYEVKVGQVMQGKCVTHEVDVFGVKEKHCIAVECKFGNTSHKKVDVKVSLYIHSRFRDLRNRWKSLPEYQGYTFGGWIMTNTDFTEDAIQYGICAGMKLISWNYPEKGNLKELIEESRLYPVTSLSSLTKAEKKQLLEKGIVMSKDLPAHQKVLEEMRCKPSKIRRIMEEVEGLCGHC